MTITWWGKTCIMIEGENGVLVANPPSSQTGLKGPKGPADLILFSEPVPPKTDWQHLVKKESVVIDAPGEWDLKGFFVFGLPATQKIEPNIFLIETEGKTMVHLADYPAAALTEEDLDKIEAVDILLISVGARLPDGQGAIDAERAIRLANQIEPRIIIPLDYATKGLKEKLRGPEEFLKEIGASGLEPQNKFVVKPKTVFSDEETQVILLKA